MSIPPITDGWRFLSWLYAVAKDTEEIEAVKVYIDGLQAEIGNAERGQQEALVGVDGLQKSLYALEERVVELTRENQKLKEKVILLGLTGATLKEERDVARKIAFDRHHTAKKHHERMWGAEAAEIAYGPQEEKHPWLRGYKP